MFRISDLEFNIDNALLDAFFDEEMMTINWGIKISAYSLKAEYERWRPKASIEIVLSTKVGEIAHWKQLAGRQASWVEKYNDDDELYGSLYVFEHNPIYESNLNFECEEDQLLLSWNAKTDVNWDEQYGFAIDLMIKTPLKFKGIWCGRKNKQACIDTLKFFLNPNEFEYTQTEHGVSLLVPIQK